MHIIHNWYQVDCKDHPRVICLKCEKKRICKECGSDNIEMEHFEMDTWYNCLNCRKIRDDKLKEFEEKICKRESLQ